MDLLPSIPLFSIFLAMLAGFVSALLPNGRQARLLTSLAAGAVTVLSGVLTLELTLAGESFSFSMGHFPAPWGNALRAGPSEGLLAGVYAAVTLLSVEGGADQTFSELTPARQPLYFSVLNLLFGAMLALLYTNDLFTAYVFLEVSTLAACAMILAKDKGESLLETLRYLVMYLVGSGFFLLGVALLYSVTGHLLMEPLGSAVGELAARGEYPVTLAVALWFLALGLMMKSAVFPFHSILPGAHSAAVTTSSAILSGLLLEIYLILLIKILLRVGTTTVAASLHLYDGMLLFGVAALLGGSLCALGERDLKRLLAYSSAAQVGYLYVGLGLGTAAGMTAALFHLICHAFTKSLLFVCAGRLIKVSGHRRSMSALRGAAHRDKMAGVGFTLGSVSLVGAPLLACFASKLYLAQSAMDGTWRMFWALGSLGAGMVLGALYLLPVVAVLWAEQENAEARAEKPERGKPQWAFAVTTVLQMGANLALGLAHTPLVSILALGLAN